MGYAQDNNNVITTSLVEGFIENDDSLTDVLPLVGSWASAPTITDSFHLTPTFILFRSTASLSTSYNSGTKKCEITIGGATDDNTKTSGALFYNNGNQKYYGDLTYLGTGSFQLDIRANSCADFTGAPDFYANNGPAQQYPDASDLKASNFDLLDISALADKYTLFNIYAKWIESMTNPAVVVPAPPKWTYEDDPKEGFRVFRYD